ADRREHLAYEVRIVCYVVDPLHGPRDDRWLDRRGKEGIRQPDRLNLSQRLLVSALLPQDHVRDETVGLSALHEATDLLLCELGVDVEQGDRVERAIPEPLKRIRPRRWADEVITTASPVRDTALPVAVEDPASLGDDAAVVRRHERGLSPTRMSCTAPMSATRAILSTAKGGGRGLHKRSRCAGRVPLWRRQQR